MRRGLGLTTVVLALAACGPVDRPAGGEDRAADADCAAKVQAAAAVVHTDHRFTDQQVPGIGTYVDIHWQTRALGNPCSRVPGPTDWQYQGLVQLAAPDAAAFAKSRTWQPSGAPPAWPALAALVPAGAAWTTADGVYFEPDRALVFFTLTDS